MAYDPLKLFVAGAIDNSDYFNTDLVWAYFSDNSREITSRFFEGSGITLGDIVLVGPKGNDEKVDLDKVAVFGTGYVGGNERNVVIDGQETECLYRYYWLEELDRYKPHSEAHEYWKESTNRFEKGEIGVHTKHRIFKTKK